MPTIKLPIGEAPYYNVDPLAKNLQMADAVIDGYVDETKTIRRRHGLKANQTLGPGPGQGLFYWTQMDRLIAVSGGRVWSITRNGSATELTGVTLNDSPIVFADGNKVGGEPWLYMADGGYPVYTQGASLTRLTSTYGAPSECTSICWSQGRFLAMQKNTRNFYATDTDPDTGEIEPYYFLAAENPLTAEARPDLLEYIRSSWEEILAWGKQGLEIWRADDTFFSSIPGAFSPIGLAAKYSVVEADNTVFALGLADEGRKVCVVKLQGRTPQVISLPIEKVLQSYSRVDDAIGFLLPDSQYVITFPTEEATWVYNYMTDRWAQWTHTSSLFVERGEYLGRYSATCWGKTFIQSRVDGTLYEYDADTYTDDGQPIHTEYVTSHIDYDTGSRKRNNYLHLNVKRGVGSLTSAATLMIRWKDDNEPAYHVNKYRLVDLGNTGENAPYIKTFRMGMYRSRQYSVVFTDDADLCLVGIEENSEVLKK